MAAFNDYKKLFTKWLTKTHQVGSPELDALINIEVSGSVPKGAYGEALSVEPTPRAQITAQYGFTDSIFSTAIGGTVANENSMFQVNTGTGPNNVAVVSSNEQVPYKAGQGLTASFSVVFDGEVAANGGAIGNTQIAGLVNSESLIGFGYKDDVFGIIFASGGSLEIQELTITTGAQNLENATITIDGNPYIVQLSSAGINANAYEIAVSLSSQVPGYNFSSNGATVNCMGLLPELGGGLFAFHQQQR